MSATFWLKLEEQNLNLYLLMAEWRGNHLMLPSLSGDLLRHEDTASGSYGKSASGSSRLVSLPPRKNGFSAMWVQKLSAENIDTFRFHKIW
jgi:hypothetical protein